MSIQLGQKVRDKVSGFTGIVISSHQYLSGCTRFQVQPPVLKKEPHKMLDAQTFDEPNLEVLEDTPVVNPTPRRGGPRNDPKPQAIPKR